MRPILVGNTDDNKPLYLTEKDLRTHVHCVGASRKGKSKIAELILRELILSREGCCVIDPHGQLYEDLVAWLAKNQPHRKIVLLNPSYTHHVVGFNPFRATGDDVNVQADRRTQATVKVFGESNTDETPRLERILRSFFHTLIVNNLPLAAIEHLVSFEARDLRDHLASKVDTTIIRSNLASLSRVTREKDFMEQVESTLNRITRFVAPLQLQRMMGLTTNNIDLEGIIERGDVLLVNLHESGVFTRENARLVGTLLLNEIWEIVRRRRRKDHRKALKDFYLFIDEFQLFLTPDIAEMLNESAKFGLHLFLFHQHLAQLQEMDPIAYASLMTNAQVKLVFGGLLREDAKVLAEQVFAGQVDLKRIKHVIERTIFHYEYDRDEVRTSSKSGGSMAATGFAHSSAISSTDQSPGPATNTYTTNDVHSGSDSIFDGWSDGVADVPIYRPVEDKEIASVTFYNLEEQLWQICDRIMKQNQRGFILARPEQETVAAIAQYVEPPEIRPERIAKYVDKTLSGFLTTDEVDQALEASRTKLLDSPKTEQTNADNVWHKQPEGD